MGIPVSDISVSEAFYARLGFKNVIQSTFIVGGEAGKCIMNPKESPCTFHLFEKGL